MCSENIAHLPKGMASRNIPDFPLCPLAQLQDMKEKGQELYHDMMMFERYQAWS